MSVDWHVHFGVIYGRFVVLGKLSEGASGWWGFIKQHLWYHSFIRINILKLPAIHQMGAKHL